MNPCTLTQARAHTKIHRLSLPFKSGSSRCLLVWNHFVQLSASPENRPSLSQATEWTERKAVQEQDGMQGGYNVRHSSPSLSVQYTKTCSILCVVLCLLDQFNRNWLGTGGQVNCQGKANCCSKREEENGWPLCEGSAYKQYCQSSQWSNWFCDNTNHNPIKRATALRIKRTHTHIRLEIQMFLTYSYLLSFVGAFLLVSLKSGRNSFTSFKISSLLVLSLLCYHHNRNTQMGEEREKQNQGLKNWVAFCDCNAITTQKVKKYQVTILYLPGMCSKLGRENDQLMI